MPFSVCTAHQALIRDCAHFDQTEVLVSGPEEVNELEMAHRGAVQLR